jgi:hypothetical protein
LLSAEAPRFAVNAKMGEIEVRSPYAGERIKHSQGFVELLLHHVTSESGPVEVVSRR